MSQPKDATTRAGQQHAQSQQNHNILSLAVEQQPVQHCVALGGHFRKYVQPHPLVNRWGDVATAKRQGGLVAGWRAAVLLDKQHVLHDGSVWQWLLDNYLWLRKPTECHWVF